MSGSKKSLIAESELQAAQADSGSIGGGGIPVSDDKTPPPDPFEDLSIDAFGDEDVSPNEQMKKTEKTNEGTKDADFDDALQEEDFDDEVNAETHEESAPQKKTDEDTSVFSDELVNEAENYGLNPDDFRTPEALERTIAQIEYRAGGVSETPVEKPPVQENTQETQGSFEFKPFEVELDPETMEPETITKTIGDMNAHYAEQGKALAQQNQTLQQRLDRLESTFRQRDFESMVSQFESDLGKLGPEWEPIFGKGPLNGPDITNSHKNNRETQIKTMNRIALGRKQNGLPALSREALMKRAAMQAFNGQAKKMMRSANPNQPRDRKGRFIQPPTNRSDTGIVTKGDAKAVSAVRDILRTSE